MVMTSPAEDGDVDYNPVAVVAGPVDKTCKEKPLERYLALRLIHGRGRF